MTPWSCGRGMDRDHVRPVTRVAQRLPRTDAAATVDGRQRWSGGRRSGQLRPGEGRLLGQVRVRPGQRDVLMPRLGQLVESVHIRVEARRGAINRHGHLPPHHVRPIPGRALGRIVHPGTVRRRGQSRRFAFQASSSRRRDLSARAVTQPADLPVLRKMASVGSRAGGPGRRATAGPTRSDWAPPLCRWRTVTLVRHRWRVQDGYARPTYHCALCQLRLMGRQVPRSGSPARIAPGPAGAAGRAAASGTRSEAGWRR